MRIRSFQIFAINLCWSDFCHFGSSENTSDNSFRLSTGFYASAIIYFPAFLFFFCLVQLQGGKKHSRGLVLIEKSTINKYGADKLKPGYLKRRIKQNWRISCRLWSSCCQWPVAGLSWKMQSEMTRLHSTWWGDATCKYTVRIVTSSVNCLQSDVQKLTSCSVLSECLKCLSEWIPTQIASDASWCLRAMNASQ